MSYKITNDQRHNWTTISFCGETKVAEFSNLVNKELIADAPRSRRRRGRLLVKQKPEVSCFKWKSKSEKKRYVSIICKKKETK